MFVGVSRSEYCFELRRLLSYLITNLTNVIETSIFIYVVSSMENNYYCRKLQVECIWFLFEPFERRQNYRFKIHSSIHYVFPFNFLILYVSKFRRR